jgi:hypothetical protein
MSAWISFVKEFAKQKEMKYTEALKNDECKELYHKNKSPVDKKKIDEMTRPKVSIQMEKVDKTSMTPKTPRAKKTKELNKEIKEEMMMNEDEPIVKPKRVKKEGTKKKI